MAFLTKAANRGSIATGYEIDNSLKFEADNTEYLNRVIASGGNRKTWTISAWVKRTEISDASHGGGHTIFAVNVSGNEGCLVRFNTGTTAATLDTIQIDIGAGGTLYRSHTSQRFRDTSAWYHIVLAVDTTQSTATDRFKLYVNGELVTSYYSRNNPAQNFDTSNNQADNSCTQHIGAYTVSGTAYGKFCGYIAEAHHIDGSQLAATDFGEFDEDSGIWKPKAYEGTYGTNGFYLDFESSGSLGADSSGNGNDFTLNNITAADQATDTPTNNFCTLFPPPDAVTGTEPSIKEGGTTMFGGSSSTQNAFGTMGVRSGKWYFESTITNSGGVGTENHNFGVIDPEQITYVMTSGRDIGASPAGWACSSNSVPRNNNAAASGANATGALNENEIMGVAIDMDNGKIWWHRQGTWTSISSTAGDPANGTTPAFSNLLTATDNFVIPAGGFYHNNGNQTRAMNFGGYAQAVFTAVGTYTDANGHGSFSYQPPSGYYALCTKNLAEYG